VVGRCLFFNGQDGNLGFKISRVGPAKSGTSPLRPPTGQDFEKSQEIGRAG